MKTLVTVGLFALTLLAATPAQGQPPQTHGTPPPGELKISAEVALESLLSLSDQHLRSYVTTLQVLAQSSEARSGAWSRLKEPLAGVAKKNVDALTWFVLPDGAYWSVQNGRESGNLRDRSYFPRLMRGETVIGDLVVSRATGKSVAILAVPILKQDRVIGALGASVYLEKLSALLEKEMGLDQSMIFFSFDSMPTVGLNWDPSLILADPLKLGEEISIAFQEMLGKDEGMVSYHFRGKKRTVLYKKSDYTRWWYGFGIIPEGREESRQEAAPTRPARIGVT